MTLNAVVQNAVMLLALCWLLAFTTRSWNRSGQLSAQLLAGLWFGSACIIGMLMTSVSETGIILDARTVVLSMAGLFGGPLVAALVVFHGVFNIVKLFHDRGNHPQQLF